MYIGIDLGGTNIAAAIVNDEGKILKKVSIPTQAEKGADSVVSGLITVCDMLLAESNDPIQAIGIGVPGMMDVESGLVYFTPNTPLSGVNIAEPLRAKFGVPVNINNDANCAALGEVYAGGGKQFDNAVFVTLGTGVGGGIVLDKKVYAGFNGTAGEIGHVVVKVDGRQCGCGRKGCWETYASATGLIKTTQEFMADHKDSKMWDMVGGDLAKVSGRTAFDAKRAGDATGSAVVDEYTKYLAAGVIDMINIFEPEAIIIGGGISNEGDYLLDPLREICTREDYTGREKTVPQTVILKAELGNDAGIVGAAMLGK